MQSYSTMMTKIEVNVMDILCIIFHEDLILIQYFHQQFFFCFILIMSIKGKFQHMLV